MNVFRLKTSIPGASIHLMTVLIFLTTSLKSEDSIERCYHDHTFPKHRQAVHQAGQPSSVCSGDTQDRRRYTMLISITCYKIEDTNRTIARMLYVPVFRNHGRIKRFFHGKDAGGSDIHRVFRPD